MPRQTVPYEPTSVTFTVAGIATSAFPISFNLFDKADLTITVGSSDLTQADFVFTGTLLDGGGYAGGTVTLNTAVENTTVVITRSVRPERTAILASSQTVPPRVLDAEFNRLTAITQDHDRQLRDIAPSLEALGSVAENADRAENAAADAEAAAQAATGVLQGVLLPETTALTMAFADRPERGMVQLIDDTISMLKPIWHKVICFQAPVLPEEGAALTDWKNPTQVAVNNGAVHTADKGFSTDGLASHYVDTGIAGTSPIGTIGVYVSGHPRPGMGQAFVGQNTIATGVVHNVLVSSTTTTFQARLNSSATVSFGFAGSSVGHFSVRRSGGTLIGYMNGTQFGTAASPEVAPSAANLTLLRGASNSSTSSQATISFFYTLDPTATDEDIALIQQAISLYRYRLLLLRELYATPEQFGAKGGAVLDLATGAVTAADDTIPLQLCRDHCVVTGKAMLLTSSYVHNGTFRLEHPITIRGQDQTTCGLFLNISREIEGVHCLGQDIVIENLFLSAYIPARIQNGQGSFGTCLTTGRIFNPPLTRNPGESDHDYAMRTAPPVAGNITLRDVLLRRRPGGAAHAMAFVGRTSGVFGDNLICEGWSPTTGNQGSLALTHWGMTGYAFPQDVDGFLLHPLINQMVDGTYTYHPNNVFLRNIKCRNTGRVLNPSASYNIMVENFDIDGFDDELTANGAQVLSLVAGDEADNYAHPDDKGKVFSNIVIRNGVAYNIDGSSPNPAGTSIIDWPGAATSKWVNTDGSLAKDDPFGSMRYDPPSLAANGGSVQVDVTVNGSVTPGTPGFTPAGWFSRNVRLTITAAHIATNTVRVTLTNNTNAAINYSEGTLTASLQRKRLESQPLFTGIRVESMRFYGLGDTTHIVNIRNTRGTAEFTGIRAYGIDTCDGLLVQQHIGKFTFKDCLFTGASRLAVSDGLRFEGCEFRTTNLVHVTVGSTTGFIRTMPVVGATTGVRGVVYSVLGATTMVLRLSDNGWQTFSGSEVLNGTGGVSSTISAITAYTNRALLIEGETEALTVVGATSAGATAIDFTALPNDVRIGDKLYFTGGVTYVRSYADTTEKRLVVAPLPVALSDGQTVTLDRRSRNIAFQTCSFIGGGRPFEAGNCYGVTVDGGEIRDGGQYGAILQTDSVVGMRDVTFSNNGLHRASLDAAASTRDVAVQDGATFHGEGLIFKDGARVLYNINVTVGARGGSLRDCVFLNSGDIGAPITGYLNIANPQTLGGRFLTDNNRNMNGVLIGGGKRYGSGTYNPASLADGAGVTTTVTVAGAALGDLTRASFSLDLQGILMTSWVSAADTVSVRFQNETTGTIDLASGTITAEAERP